MKTHRLAPLFLAVTLLCLGACGSPARVDDGKVGVEATVKQLSCPATGGPLVPTSAKELGGNSLSFPAASNGSDRGLFFTRPYESAGAAETQDETLLSVGSDGTFTQRSFAQQVGGPARVFDLAFAQDRFVAVGHFRGSLAVWSSTTGDEWILSLQRASLRGATLAEIAFGPSGWVVVTVSADDVFIVRSRDLKEWSQEVPAPAAIQAIQDLSGGPSGYVAVSDTFRQGEEPGDSQALAWFSRDGMSWNEALRSKKPTRVEKIVWGSDHFVVAGSDAHAPAVWTSQDGRRWEEFRGCDVGKNAPPELRSLSVASAGFVAVGAGFALSSVDGLNWSQVGFMPRVTHPTKDTALGWDIDSQAALGETVYVSIRSGASEITKVSLLDLLQPRANN